MKITVTILAALALLAVGAVFAADYDKPAGQGTGMGAGATAGQPMMAGQQVTVEGTVIDLQSWMKQGMMESGTAIKTGGGAGAIKSTNGMLSGTAGAVSGTGAGSIGSTNGMLSGTAGMGAGATSGTQMNWQDRSHQQIVDEGGAMAIMIKDIKPAASGAGPGAIGGTNGMMSGTAGAGAGSVSGTMGAGGVSGTAAYGTDRNNQWGRSQQDLRGAGMGAAGQPKVLILGFNNDDQSSKTTFSSLRKMVGQQVQVTGMLVGQGGCQGLLVSTYKSTATGTGAGSIGGTNGMFSGTAGGVSGTAGGVSGTAKFDMD